MKLYGVLLAMLLVCGVASAQTSMFNKGDKVLNLGIGFGSGYYSGGGYSHSPAISASVEAGVVDNVFDDKGTIGVGGYIGFGGAKYRYFGYTYKYSNVIIAARGALHYPLVEKLDTYIGLALGYNVVSSKTTGSGTQSSALKGSGVYFSGFVGGRYYFDEKFAALLELGSGIAYLNLGIAIKF